MPSVSSNIYGKPRIPSQFGGSPLVGTRHSPHAQRAFRNSKSRSLGRNRSALTRSYGFSVEIGRVPNGFLDDGKEIEEVIMMRRLNG